MACPFFMPTSKLEDGGWLHPSRLPLGGGWTGHCSAPGHEGAEPTNQELRELCNLGYAASCPRLPKERAYDAVRFSIARDCGATAWRFGSSASRVIVLPAMESWNTISRPQASGSPRTPICAFRKWQNVTCKRTCCVGSSPPWRVAVRAQVHDQKPRNQNPMNQNNDVMLPRPVRDSQSEMAEIVLPNDANPLGALLGGRLMHWIDLAGAMAAHRHSRNYVVTAAIDHLDFWVPVHVGDLVILRSSVNRVFRTSMEVGVKVWVENYIADNCEHVSSAYLTFVAIDAGGRHLQVPAVIPETEDRAPALRRCRTPSRDPPRRTRPPSE